MPAFFFLFAVEKNDIHVICLSDAIENAGAEAWLCWVFDRSRRPAAAGATSCNAGYYVARLFFYPIAQGRLP